VRLFIFRHSFGSIVCDLLLGFRHGNRAFRGTCNRVVILGGWLVVRQVIELVNLSMLLIKDLLEGCRQILEQMKSVGDLRGFWSALPNARGIGFCSVPGDNRDIGMGLKPRGHGFSRSIFKQVNGATPLEIDDNGAVAMAFTPRPVVDANDCRFRALRQTQAAHTSQEGIATPW